MKFFKAEIFMFILFITCSMGQLIELEVFVHDSNGTAVEGVQVGCLPMNAEASPIIVQETSASGFVDFALPQGLYEISIPPIGTGTNKYPVKGVNLFGNERTNTISLGPVNPKNVKLTSSLDLQQLFGDWSVSIRYSKSHYPYQYYTTMSRNDYYSKLMFNGVRFSSLDNGVVLTNLFPSEYDVYLYKEGDEQPVLYFLMNLSPDRAASIKEYEVLNKKLFHDAFEKAFSFEVTN